MARRFLVSISKEIEPEQFITVIGCALGHISYTCAMLERQKA